MPRSLRQVDARVHLSHEVTLEALGKIISPPTVKMVLEALGKSELRVRKLTMVIVVFVCIAMNLYSEEAVEDVLKKLMQGPRFLRPEENIVVASKGAIAQRRQQLGVAPMVSLFRKICQPIATRAPRGLFVRFTSGGDGWHQRRPTGHP